MSISITNSPVVVSVTNNVVTLTMVGVQGPQGVGVPVGGTSNQVLAKNTNTDFDTKWVNQTGSLTSVGVGMPIDFNVAGSPITSNGTINITWNSNTANKFLATPSGSSGIPTLRIITKADLTATTVFTDQSNTWNAGTQIFQGSGFGSTIPIVIKGASGQSVNLQEWQNSSGTALTVIDSAGRVGIGTNPSEALHILGGNIKFDSTSSGVNGIFKFAVSGVTKWNLYTYTSDSFRWSNGSGLDRMVLSQAGNVLIGTGINGVSIPATSLTVINGAATDKGLVVKGAASQSANLTEWQNSSGTVLSCVDSGGNICVGNGQSDGGTGAKLSVSTGIYTPGFVWATGGINFSANNTIVPGTDAANSVRLTGANGLQFITGGGFIRYNGGVGFSVYQNDNTTLGLINVGYITASSPAVGTVPITVKGAASQSANLTEWQNSSGTVLSCVDKSGGFTPVSMADSAAANGTIYYSTTANKLVFKDSGGTVNNLY